MSGKCLTKFVAIHYRSDRKVQGCWKEFNSKDEAISWLNIRKNKTDDSPKEGIVFDVGLSFENLDVLVKDHKNHSFGLISAIESYLANQQRLCDFFNKLTK